MPGGGDSVGSRYENTRSRPVTAMKAISAAELRTGLNGPNPPIVIDVRRSERFREALDLVRGALRRDPARVAEWAETLPESASVVVYCVHGHEVSQDAAKALISQGI
jgi:rhodanese-related sulfurtransferase